MVKKVISFLILFAVITLTAMILPVAIVALVGSFTELSHHEYVQKLSGLDVTGSTIISVEDTHGGFHGDGELIVIFDCTEIADSVATQITDWTPLPMTANLQTLMYGNEHTNGLAGRLGIPEIRSGYYFFWDRHSESTDRTNDNELNNRHSWNFTVLLYDSDHSLLYLFEFDT